MAKKEIPKRVGLVGAALVWDWFKNWAWTLFPTVPTIVSFVSAKAQSLPIWLSVLVAAIVFWALVSGFLACKSLWLQSSVHSRLVIPGVVFQSIIDDDKNITGLKVGIRVVNISTMPIEYEVNNISTDLDGRINPDPARMNRGAVVPPGVEFIYWDAAVPAPSEVAKDVKGSFKAEITYGKVGRLKHLFHLEHHLAAKLSRDGKYFEYIESYNKG